MNKTAQDKTRELLRRQYKVTGVFLSIEDAETLRRAELTLTSWALEVSNGTIERPWEGTVDGDARPYRAGKLFGQYCGGVWTRIADREAGALRRVAEVCKRNGLEFFHQGDPTGCALYIARQGQGMNDTNYSSFVPCFVK